MGGNVIISSSEIVAQLRRRQASKAVTASGGGVSLEKAISTAPVAELRKFVLEMSHLDQVVKDCAMRRFLIPINGSNSHKRKALKQCANCEAEYRVEDHKAGVCQYHEGILCIWRSSLRWRLTPSRRQRDGLEL